MAVSRVKSSLIGRLHRSKTRQREGLVLVEGVRAVTDVLETGAKARFAVRSARGAELGGAALEAALAKSGVEVIEAEDRELAELADTETPQGVLAVVEEPARLGAAELGTRARGGGSCRVVVLDGVQDPGNVGTLVRTAAGFGLDAVVALDGTSDPWSAKATRAAAAANFRIDIFRMTWEDFGSAWAPLGWWVADAGGADVHRHLLPVSDQAALVLGSEGNGPRAEAFGEGAVPVSIPLENGVESLNVAVAGAILMRALLPPPTPRS